MKEAQKLVIARDISWLSFNERVLQEAQNKNNPLIERIRFLGIFSKNMDEFFRVRYASIKRLSQLNDSVEKRLGGYTPEKILEEISNQAIEMQSKSQETNDILIAELEKEDIYFVNEKNLTINQQEFVRKYFIEKVSPTVFTLILNERERMPELRDKSIYLAIKLIRNNEPEKPDIALTEVPSDLLGRFVKLPKFGKQYIMYLEDVIRYNLEYILFIYDFDWIEAHTIKITRDAELDVDDDISKSFLEKITRSLKNRLVGDPVRLVYDKDISNDMLQFLVQKMNISSYDSLISGGRYHNKKDYIKFPPIGKKSLEFEPLPSLPHPDLNMDQSILNVLRKKDVLLFLPYHSFSYYIRTLREAAIDPNVLSIRVTLYRLADKSSVINALINAAKNGKQVTTVIELRARFDEKANIKWTEELQMEGVQVISGVPGLKVHGKLLLITRKEGDKTRLYASIGTGNFNESTAKLYIDYHLLTARQDITKEVKKVFDFLEKNYKIFNYKHLFVSPYTTRKFFLRLIDKEIEHAKKGNPTGIFIKMNSLSDIKLIEKLYEASCYGIQIRLIIRGICSLVPGIKGISENIEAISILDRFLEHSRVIVFENGGNPKYFISSADWMPRNLDYRVEVTTPIYDNGVKKQLREHLKINWRDNVKARRYNEKLDNAYRKIKGPKIRSQYALYDYVKKQSNQAK